MWFPFFKRKTKKWSTERIRLRFDVAALDFEKLDDGQPEIIDVALMLDLLTQAAARVCPQAKCMLDVGCGAGLYSLRMLELLPSLHITLTDLSANMLSLAAGRINTRMNEIAQTARGKSTEDADQSLFESPENRIRAIHGDIREITLNAEHYDLVLAGAVLHHLREQSEWESVFEKLYTCLKPGGALWISDLVCYSSEPVQQLMSERYSSYLTELKGARYSKSLFKYIEKEDSPRSLVYQVSLLQKVGFTHVEVLHHNTCFSAFGGIK